MNAKGEPRAGGGASKPTATKAPEPKAPEKPKSAPAKVCINKSNKYWFQQKQRYSGNKFLENQGKQSI